MKSCLNIILLISFIGLSAVLNAQQPYIKNLQKLSKSATDNNYSDVEREFEKAVEKNNSDACVFYERSLFYRKFYKDTLSLQDIDKAIQLMPEKRMLYELRFDIRSDLGLFNDVLEDVNMMIKLNDTIPDPYIYKGDYYSRIDNQIQAIINYNKAIELYEKNNSPCSFIHYCYAERGRLNLGFGKVDDAINDFTKVIDNNNVKKSKKGYVYILRAKAFAIKNDNRKFQDIDSAILMKSDTTTLGYLYALRGNVESTEKMISATLKYESIEKNKRNIYYNIACYYSILNDKKKALEYIEKTLQSGYKKFNWIQMDFDLFNIKSSPEFIALIQKYQTNKQN